MGRLKQDLAKEMGIWELIEKGGWGNLPAKDCGRIGGKMGSRLSTNLLRKIATMDEDKSVNSGDLATSLSEKEKRR
ncbi:MAG: small, acid-soluble spore protein, alpha/beta type [Firmicutes bacterium]|nr:small, acid-soluble spore protein, alpha/beta type [Bacillota bacterium]